MRARLYDQAAGEGEGVDQKKVGAACNAAKYLAGEACWEVCERAVNDYTFLYNWRPIFDWRGLFFFRILCRRGATSVARQYFCTGLHSSRPTYSPVFHNFKQWRIALATKQMNTPLMRSRNVGSRRSCNCARICIPLLLEPLRCICPSVSSIPSDSLRDEFLITHCR